MPNTNKMISCPDTLYPSSAPTVLSREADEYATRWNAVWAEATPIPVASRVDVDSDVGGPVAVPMGAGEEPRRHPQNGMEQMERHNIVVLMFGNLFLAIAMILTFSLELVGAIVYLMAAGFDWMVDKLRHGGTLLALFYWIFWFVVCALLFADAVVLVSGILVQESLALTTFILCFLVGGPCAALEWHQAVRRSCHLFRWAFRGFHEKWSCQRVGTSPPRPTKQEQQQQQQQVQQPHHEVIQAPSADAPRPVPTAPPEDETIVLNADDILEISDPLQAYKS